MEGQDFRQILPASGGDIAAALCRHFYPVEMLLFQIQIAGDGIVDALFPGVLLPDAIIRLHLHDLQAVQGGHVEFPDGFVVLRRIACGDDDPALRHSVAAEGLILKELEHGRGQGLGHAVDLIQEQDALSDAAVLTDVVDGGDNLAHGVFRDAAGDSPVGPLGDKGEPQRGLPGVVGHGVAHQSDAHLLGNLLHDGSLADARGSQQENGALAHRRYPVFSEFVLFQVKLYRVFDVFLGLFYIHVCLVCLRLC